MKKGAIILAVLWLCLLGGACKQKSHPTEESTNFDYPTTAIPETIAVDVMDETPLYPMTEEFLESFLEKAGTYAGHPITAKATLPQEWGVRCVERLPEGRELWLLQSQNREWMYLAITSGFGTQRILDLLPVGLDLTNQSPEELETEKWTTTREADGAFLVNKAYERTRSLTHATKQEYQADPEKFHKEVTFLDTYYINDSGRFEYVEVVDTIPEYSAVVFFYNRSEKPELWDENIPRLQAFCEENNIFYEEVYSNYDQVNIRNFTMALILTVDINPMISNTESGMVMLKKGENPKVVNFGGYEYMQMEIKRYFKIHNPEPEVL